MSVQSPSRPAGILSDWRKPPVFRAVAIASLFLFGSTAMANSAVATASLAVSVSPAEAGSTIPAGTSTQPMDVEVSITAMANLGWSFVKWSVTSGDLDIYDAESWDTVIALYSDAAITAVFEPGGVVTLSTAAVPAEAGSVTPATSAAWNVGELIEIIATPASDQFLFGYWDCSDGVEVMDYYAMKSAIRLDNRAPGGAALVTACFLTRQPDTAASASFKAKYTESFGSKGITVSNTATFTGTFPVDLTGLDVDEETSLYMEFSDGMSEVEFLLGDDPNARITERGGSAKFVETDDYLKKKVTTTTMKWDAKSLKITYSITVPADFNLLDLYSQIYGTGGKTVPVNSSAAPLPTYISVEGLDWIFVWQSKSPGLGYTGKGASKYNKKYGDGLVSWDVSGSGALETYFGDFSPSGNPPTTSRAEGGAQ